MERFDQNGNGKLSNSEIFAPDSLPPFKLTVNADRLPSGAIDQLKLSFPTKLSKSYQIEASSNLHDWEILENGINGIGATIQRDFPASAAT